MTETFISYDLLFKGTYVKPGSKIKIKGKWETYTYISILCLGDLQEVWIICEDSKGNKERFAPGRIRKVLGKRSYLKNV